MIRKAPPHLRIARAELLDAFNERVCKTASGCWEWNGLTNTHGYAIIAKHSGNIMGHRASYYLFKGDFDHTADIMHLCHNPQCTNPDHLEVGTRKQNMVMSQKDGRLQRHIPLDQIERIQAMRKQGMSLAQIGRVFGCTKQSVRHTIIQHKLDDSGGRKRDQNTMITFRGQTRSLREWAKIIGIPCSSLRFRYVRSGWSAERSLTEPIIRGPAHKRKPLLPT